MSYGNICASSFPRRESKSSSVGLFTVADSVFVLASRMFRRLGFALWLPFTKHSCFSTRSSSISAVEFLFPQSPDSGAVLRSPGPLCRRSRLLRVGCSVPCTCPLYLPRLCASSPLPSSFSPPVRPPLGIFFAQLMSASQHDERSSVQADGLSPRFDVDPSMLIRPGDLLVARMSVGSPVPVDTR